MSQSDATQPATVPAPAQGESKTTVIAEEAEPQNALTQKFTEAEWAALKEFRVSHCSLRLVEPLIHIHHSSSRAP
jgi:hypothetical protein